MHKVWHHNLDSTLSRQAVCLGEEDQLEQRGRWGVDREATGLKININTDFLKSVVCKWV